MGKASKGVPSEAQEHSALLRAVCHDLRAPLAAVTMGTNFVLKNTRDDADERTKRVLEAMLRSCSQMERLIRNFADLATVESHSVALNVETHDVADILDGAAHLAAESALAKKVSLDVTALDPPTRVPCDRERLLRAIGHVLDHAIDLAPEGTAVAISASVSKSTLAFRVTNQGPGLATEVAEHLFDRAWQADKAKKPTDGFALSVARGFALAHGGDLVVESAANPTSLRFEIPVGGLSEPRSTTRKSHET